MCGISRGQRYVPSCRSLPHSADCPWKYNICQYQCHLSSQNGKLHNCSPSKPNQDPHWGRCITLLWYMWWSSTIDGHPTVVTMYTTSGAQNAQHQWTETITTVGAPSYINVQAYKTFSSNTLTSTGGSTLGCKAFLCIKRSHILFTLVTVEIWDVRFEDHDRVWCLSS